MEKLVYGLWRRPDQDIDPIRTALLERVAPVAARPRRAGAPGVRRGAGGQGVPGRRQPRRQPAGRLRVALDRQLRQPRARTRRPWPQVDAQTYGWIVAESEALAYGDNRTWPDGEQSPGLSITTFFDKKEGLSDEDFYRIWHGEHTPLSFEIHPLWLYVRNQVLRSLTPGAPPVRGIVYEAVPTDKHLLDFNLFFGGVRGAEQAHRQHPPRQRPHGHLRQHRHAAVRPDAGVDLPHLST